ncbi:hypothetical protein OVA13_11365 [Pseudoxanthomonas sp. SL93]|uniref:P-loop NTPase fold protein n=1 Tax=Pseudoxanthomonas sp. SL93 TaxID=2995142 RepID=UPI002271ADC0|nr:P-loop NTPase fold protein [Pseudoxanthomonas sp. SL93]WAC62002.1 hypothetical protein OVA13_11365 [Pseudoxanthomonas sp. SL93]
MSATLSAEYPLSLVLDDSTKPQVRALQKFILQKTPSVLALQGKWGRGKTHLWQSLLRTSTGFGMAKYCYVSLFGLNSLSDLKRSLFERSIPSSDAHRPSVDQSFNIETLRNFWKENPIRKSTGALSRLSNPWTGSLGDQWSSVAYGMFKDHLVCLDDLERRGDGLLLKDVLGVVSQLAVEKGCAVLIISNVEQLNAQDRIIWAEHREKVVDRAMTYAPEVGAAIRAAFGEPSDECQREALVILEKLKSSNLRIASRVISNVDAALAESDPELHEGAKRAMAKSIAVLTYCHEGRAEGAPPVSRALKHGHWSGVAAALGNDDRSSDEKAWDGILDDVAYYPDQIDQCFAKFVSDGYFPAEYRSLLKDFDRKHRAEDVAAVYSAVWSEFHDGYGGDAELFAGRFYEATLASAQYESALNIDSSICLLRELDKDAWAEECGAAWVASRLPLAGPMFQMKEIELFRPIRDAWFRARVEKARNDAQSTVTLREAMSNISSRLDDQEGSYAVVASSSVEEIRDWLIETKGAELRSSIKGILDPYPVASASAAKRKLGAALRLISRSNRLDQIRVARLALEEGIETADSGEAG